MAIAITLHEALELGAQQPGTAMVRMSLVCNEGNGKVSFVTGGLLYVPGFHYDGGVGHTPARLRADDRVLYQHAPDDLQIYGKPFSDINKVSVDLWERSGKIWARMTLVQGPETIVTVELKRDIDENVLVGDGDRITSGGYAVYLLSLHRSA